MTLFFELLRIALERQAAFSMAPSQEEWGMLLAEARKQAVVGVCFAGIERLPEGQRPPREVLMQWWALTHQIEERNALMDEKTVQAWHYFVGKGFRTILLKGQGNALWYPQPHRRQSGDIDLWVTTGQMPFDAEESRKEVIRFVQTRFPKERANMKHIHFPADEEVLVEVHFEPGLLREYFANRRLQKFFAEEMKEPVVVSLGEGEKERLAVPSWEMNAVFLLVHLFDHFMYEGVGLRQVVDYFYFLQEARRQAQFDVKKVREVLKEVHLLDFAGAVMWVEHEVLGLEEDAMVVEADERRGRLLLEEIMAGGNFGQYDARYARSRNPLMRFAQRMRRSLRFLTHYPLMTLSAPAFYVAQRVWMIIANKEIR